MMIWSNNLALYVLSLNGNGVTILKIKIKEFYLLLENDHAIAKYISSRRQCYIEKLCLLYD